MDKKRINPLSGLNDEEYKIILLLVDIWNLYLELEDENSDDTIDLKNCIHLIQRIMSTRCSRRDYPLFWRQ